MRKILMSLAVVVALVGGMNLAAAPIASAAASSYGCSGSLVYSKNLTASGEVWSTFKLYYSSANGGTNCAVLVAKKFAGTRHFMSVSLWVDGRSGTDTDEGQFSSYAGPVTRTNTNGHCISGNTWENSPTSTGPQAGMGVNSVACG